MSEDNDCSDAMLMSVDIKDGPEEYKDIIRYLKGMDFPKGATKQIRTKIAHKSRSYTLIVQLLYFCGRDGILRRTVGKIDLPNCYKSFMKVFVENILRNELQWRKSLRRVTIGRRCSMILLTITSVAKCTKHL